MRPRPGPNAIAQCCLHVRPNEVHQTHADAMKEARACNTSEDRTVLSWATIHKCHEGGKSHELRPYVELHSESDSIRE